MSEPGDPENSRKGKGERTAAAILDAAETHFARQGYHGTSLRNIANSAGLQEPGIYNHFASKEAIYAAVLHRILDPVGSALSRHLAEAHSLPEMIELPGLLMDLLVAQPNLAPLLQRALREEAGLPGNTVLHRWLARLFNEGMAAASAVSEEQYLERERMAINLLAIFNAATGYFVSGPAFALLEAGDPWDRQNLARQKQLLHRMMRAMMVS
ncbi:TetR/AcrR family transcriptional regulator [Parahaliea aestuarii]|uniref:TetR/AcrR family transcriptional regulator n=1 Tax=Parahaliea aestuarii TaxID=1852021 RepID=A0A5C8ZXV2_9GAMM|nr:TetR/AcrR family transcriptional regulator [Parahaliea aestuarii]TXS93316.1 TetR/AcrR family transcriptional regulator [Parahaliea aestuarii]